MIGCDYISKSLSEYETPIFIYNGDVLLEDYDNLKSSFNGLVDVFYSIKANPNLGICQILQKAGSGAEVCSFHELRLAIDASYSPEDIIVVGPYKSQSLLEESLKIGVFAIVCESWFEYEKICTITETLKKRANILIRINPKVASSGALLKMGGRATQFGIDEDTFFSTIETLKHHRLVNIIGLHMYSGTRLMDYRDIVSNTKYALDLFVKTKEKYGLPLKCIDFGGGFGVNYFEGENKLNLQSLQDELEPILRDFTKLHDARIIAESGRFLTARSGIFVIRVEDIKDSHGKTYAITNGGSNCFLSAVNGSFLKKNFPITVRSDETTTDKSKYQICGPLCTPGDLIAKDVVLQKLKVGDFLVLHQAGAYGLTASIVMFLSQSIASEIVWYMDRLHLIRDCKKVEEVFSKQNSLFKEVIL